MSAIGTPAIGDRPVFIVDDSVTEIKQGDILVLTDTMTVKPADSTTRDKIIGVAAEDYPKVTNTAGITYVDEAEDRGPRVFAATSGIGAGKRIAVDMEGTVWCNVKIPADGDNITITEGTKIVPGTQAGVTGGVEPLAALTTLADFPATVLAINESKRVIGIALSNIHKGFKRNDADYLEGCSLGTNEISDGILAKDASDPQYGKVFVKLTL